MVLGDTLILIRVSEYGPNMTWWEIKIFYKDFFPLLCCNPSWTLCQQDLAFWMGRCHCSSNLTTHTTAFNVQCTLKSLLRKLYDSALQCNFCIKAFYHNRIINSNLFISFPLYKLVLSQNSKYFNPLLIVQRENNNKDYHGLICPYVKLWRGHEERPSEGVFI